SRPLLFTFIIQLHAVIRDLHSFPTRRSSDLYWQSLCEKSGVPSGPIQTLDQMREDPQLKARDMFVTMEHPKAGKIDLIGSPLKLSRTPVEMKYHPPEVGEHEEEILHLIKKIKENTNDEL